MMNIMGNEVTKDDLANMIKDLDYQIEKEKEKEIPPEPKVSKGFTVKCNECGNEVVLTEKNMSDYFKGFGWNRYAKESDIKDNILISYTEDCEADTILCSCGSMI